VTIFCEVQVKYNVQIFIQIPKEQNGNLNWYALVTDVSGGYSPSVLDAIRNALEVSIHTSFGMGADYAPLTYHEAFYLATLGGARGIVNCCYFTFKLKQIMKIFEHLWLSSFSLYEGVSKSFWTELITKQTMTTLIEKQHKGLWWQNSLD
jgi:hypothetical protein